jgi:hypothetical protein
MRSRGATFNGSQPSGGVTLIAYRGEIVATAGARRIYLAPRLASLGDGDPLLTFVAFMAAYAMRVRDGSAPGPYTHERAERFARLALMEDDQFRMFDANRLDDRLIAGHFGVPVEQVEAKRNDLELLA